MRRPRLRAAAVLAAVFALGVLVGIALERHHRAPPRDERSAEAEHRAAMAELRDALDLDDAQVEAIDEVVARRQETVQAMWEELRPDVEAEMRRVHEEVAELLRPEQRRLFHDWLMERSEAGTLPSFRPHGR